MTSDVSHANPSAICSLGLDLSLRGSVICILYSSLTSISGDRGVFVIDEQRAQLATEHGILYEFTWV